MSFRPPEHELHRRRLGRNLGLGAALLLFVFLVFGMTIEKVAEGGASAAAMLGQAPPSSANAVKPAGGGIAVKAVSATETGPTSGGGN